MPKTPAERQSAYVARLAKSGGETVTVRLEPAAKEVLDGFRAKGQSPSVTVNQALIQFGRKFPQVT